MRDEERKAEYQSPTFGERAEEDERETTLLPCEMLAGAVKRESGPLSPKQQPGVGLTSHNFLLNELASLTSKLHCEIRIRLRTTGSILGTMGLVASWAWESRPPPPHLCQSVSYPAPQAGNS